MEIEKIKSIIEAILFATGRIVTQEELVLALEIDKNQIEESKIPDTTVAKQDLPRTGIKTITILVTIFIIIAIIIYRRYKKYEDIK